MALASLYCKKGKERFIVNTHKRRRLAALLAVFLTVGPVLSARAAQDGLAYASTQSVEVDGKNVEFQMYALKDANGYDTNYVKLRDVAYVLNGTNAQFNVEWYGAVRVNSGTAYSPNGSEMYTPYSGNRAYTKPGGTTVVDGTDRYLDAILLNDDDGGGYTYYKLRDLGDALGFTVDWSSERGVYIETQPKDPEAEPEEFEEVPFQNNAYIVLSLDEVTSWEAAGAYCAQQGGHLATIDSQAENDYVSSLLTEAGVGTAFLGLSKEGEEWIWYNGLPLAYSNWASGQPGSKAYAMMDNTQGGRWVAGTFPRTGNAVFVCEWDG